MLFRSIGKKTPGRSLLLRRDPSTLGVLGPLEILGPSIRRSPLPLETEDRPPPSLFLSVFLNRSRGYRSDSRRDFSPARSLEVKVSFSSSSPLSSSSSPCICVWLPTIKVADFRSGKGPLFLGLFSLNFPTPAIGIDRRPCLLRDRGSGPRRPPTSAAVAVA